MKRSRMKTLLGTAFRLLAPIGIAALASARLHAAAPAQAQMSVPPWRGIWTGSIGNENIVACLDRNDDSGAENSGYYYLRHGTLIPLTKSDAEAAHWVEGEQRKTTGTWALDAVDGRSIDGVWRDAESRKTLAIHLIRARRVTDKQSDFWFADDLCHGVSFYRPLAEATPLKKGDTQFVQGKRYRRITMTTPLSSDRGLAGPAIDSVELLEPGANIDAINRILRERYLNRIARHHVSEPGGLAEFFENVVGFSDNRLTLDEMEWTAGYGISGTRRWTEVWDLRTLKLISEKDQP
jgi:hypothetical protein